MFLHSSTQEAWYYMQAPKKVTHKDLLRESTKLSATADVDSDLLSALCDTEQGFMRVGATQQILDAVGKARQFEN